MSISPFKPLHRHIQSKEQLCAGYANAPLRQFLNFPLLTFHTFSMPYFKSLLSRNSRSIKTQILWPLDKMFISCSSLIFLRHTKRANTGEVEMLSIQEPDHMRAVSLLANPTVYIGLLACLTSSSL